jgi:DNA recombination-dependent growth factor C
MSPLGFFVKGKVEDWDAVVENLTRFRFQDLDPATGRQQSFGWVRCQDPFATDFSKPNFFFGESMVCLTMRVDSITVPASQVKLHLGRRVKAAMQESGKETISKDEVARMREDLVAEMSRKMLPSIKLFDMGYNAATGRLWFFGRSKSAVQTFLDLFHETFGLSMVPDSPYTVARELLGEEAADGLMDLPPASFASEA